MNRRLPRFAILVVMLLSMLVVFQMRGNGTPAELVLAQGESCDLIVTIEEAQAIAQQAEGTPISSESVRILSSINAQSAGPQGIELAANAISLELFAETDLSFASEGSSIIFVEQGTVTLTVCPGSPPVAVQHSTPDSPFVVMDTSAGPAIDTLEAGSTIHLAPGAVYYLQSSDDAVLTTMSFQILYMSCGGTSC